MVIDMRPFSLSTYQALKTATRAQLSRFGKQENAAEALSTVQSAVSDWASANRMDRFMPVDKMMDAAALTGEADLLRAVASELGYTLVAMPRVEGDGVLVKRLGQMAKETSEAIAAIANALATDGDITPKEVRELDLENQLNEAIEQMVGMRSLVREVRRTGERAHG
ncbi:MAG: phage regulatory CII family protein [Parvibaculum sp.]